MDNKSIIKELNLEDRTFNLKSQTTGKYSVQDSYRENYNNGFLLKVNAPEDINSALKDIYYATEKGLVISYKDFNGKIVSVRKGLLAKNFPGKELKDLSKEEKLKIEMESAKQVLRDLYINETTKLIYSPELSLAKEEAESQDLRLKFLPEQLKVIFHESEDKEKERLVKIYLEFSEKVKPLADKANSSYNLDEIELTMVSVENMFNSLDEDAQNNNDINSFYKHTRESLELSANEMKERQAQLEKDLNERVDSLIKNNDFKNIKNVIDEIQKTFISNLYIASDPKSNSIKDLAINQLKNIGKVIALIALKNWDENNFKIAESLIGQINNDLTNLLKKKISIENDKREEEERKLLSLELNNSDLIYNKFLSLVEQKDMFRKLFGLITENGYETINKLITENENMFGFIVLLSNNLALEKSEELWKSFSEEIISNISNRIFPYQSINSIGIRNIYFEIISEKSTNEIIEEVFNNIKAGVLLNIDNIVISKLLLRLTRMDYPLNVALKKLIPEKLIKILKTEIGKTSDYIRNSIISVLAKWVITLEPDSPEFKFILSEYPEFGVYNLKNKQVEALNDEFILEILEKLENKKEPLHYFMLRIGKDKFDAAMKLKLKRMVESEPDNFDNHYNLGLSHFKAKDYENAVNEFKICIGLNPESYLAHYTLGYLYDQIERYDLAIPEYKKAIQLKYNYVEAYYNLGLIYNRMKDHFLAAQQFKKILKIEPENYNAILSLGISYEDMNEFDQAKNEYEKAINIDPKRADAYINLAQLYSSKDSIDQAIEMYKLALDYESDNPKTHYNLGLLYHRQDKYPLAKAHYKTSIKYDKSNSQVYNNLGLIYFVKAQLQKAINAWTKAIEIDNNIDAYNNLGWAYCLDNNFEKSIETYENAKKVKPDYPLLYLNLGTVYYRMGNAKKAVVELERYLELEDEDSDNKFEVMKIIKNIRYLE